MFLILLSMMGEAPAPVPAVANLQTVGHSGDCQAQAWATVDLSWTVVNADAELYDTKVYRDDLLLDTIANDVDEYEYEVTNYLAYGPEGQWESDYVFRVDVVRKSDGQVVSSAEAAPWQQVYGWCRPE